MGAVWIGKIYGVRVLMTEKEDAESVRASMAAIADKLDKSNLFTGFDTTDFRNIPDGDNCVSIVEKANALIDRMYDYADYKRIWID